MITRTITIAGLAAALILLAAGCAAVPRPGERPAAPTAGPALSVIPKPVKMETRSGAFLLGPDTKISIVDGQDKVLAAAGYLAECLRRPTGFAFPLETSANAAPSTATAPGSIVLRLEDLGERLGPEGYLLDVSAAGIQIRAAAPAGLFYGVQTLLQLLPAAIESSAPAAGSAVRWAVPCVSIEDRPRFAWRGAMLDCSRHFFPKEFVKRWIDILAAHKMNTFHWHLTDDQGWRLEIKKYPRLTEIGAWRVDRESQHWNARQAQKPGEAATYGGFYTQDDVREIVAYAAARSVTVVPEIEMPGHCRSALAAYPEFSCTGGPFTVLPGGYWPVTDVYCPGNDATFAFLKDILDEVVGLFPGKYIHIGGDEVDKTEWKRCPKCQARMKAEGLKDENELQSWFVRRVESFLNEKGRTLIGWDEILEGGLAPRAAVMSWRGTEGGIAAAKAGHDVVMTPTSHCYFDYYQGIAAAEPLAIGGFLPLSKVYSFEPVPDVLTEDEAARVAGGQANLWTEYVPVPGHAEYMLLPRAAALAEAVWSAKGARDWPDFCRRLEGLMAHYDAAGLNYARSAFQVRMGARTDASVKKIIATLDTEIPGLDIRYTTDGTAPLPTSKRCAKPLTFKKTTELRAAAFKNGLPVSPGPSSERFIFHAASGRTPVLETPASPKYAAGGAGALTDGLLGSKNIADGRWLGFEGGDMGAVIDLGRSRAVRKIAARSLQNINSWVFLPVSVEFAVSPDGRAFEVVSTVANDVSPRASDIIVKEFAAAVSARKARFVRVRARSIGTIPEWHYAAGDKAWLFVDEIVVE